MYSARCIKIKTNVENKVTKIFRMNLQSIFEKEK